MGYAWAGPGFPGFEFEAKQGWPGVEGLYHRKHAMGCAIQGPGVVLRYATRSRPIFYFLEQSPSTKYDGI
jgi:hypothetical protein